MQYMINKPKITYMTINTITMEMYIEMENTT